MTRRVLVLEPYNGGSHATVLEGLLERIPWEADVLTLPARKWKWRMRGSAMTMADEVALLAAAGRCWDLVLCSTFLNLAEFRGLAPRGAAGTPAIVYFHENQIVYPVRHEAEWDLQFPLTNITSALSADACLFNSRYNLESFLEGVEPFLKRFPDHHPKRVAQRIGAKSAVLPPPFDPGPFDRAPVCRGERVRIAWPHRWEHDKDPDAFFRVAGALAEEGLEFEVAVLGQRFSDEPEVFARAQEVLGDRLVHMGEPDTRTAYAALLASSDVSVSTAWNEFFGLAMMESAYAGCFPLVPCRLSYPELYDDRFLYDGEEGLAERLRGLVAERPAPGTARRTAEGYTFDRLVPRYEEVFSAVADGLPLPGGRHGASD